MRLINLQDQRLMYLGTIDDKVVQYQNIKKPEQELLRALFFSAILGDPLVLNDGYLLHHAWGRKQLTDPNSPVRQLNKGQHLLLAARSDTCYSEWISAQAEKTRAYRELLGHMEPGELELLDAAWSECVGTSWPTLDLQATMRRMLRSGARAALEHTVPAAKLAEHDRRFEIHLGNGQTVRSAWEDALLEMDTLGELERSDMMEFANEVYHASFACGFAGSSERAEVGIAGFGERRLHHQSAYAQESGVSLDALLESEHYRRAEETLRSLAVVYVSNQESDLFSGSRLADFVANAGKAKTAYRNSLQALLRSEEASAEKIEALEHSLEIYGEALRECFGGRKGLWENRAVVQVIDLMTKAGAALNNGSRQMEIAGQLCGFVSQHGPAPVRDWATAVQNGISLHDLVQAGLPVASNVYYSLQQRRLQRLDLLGSATSSSGHCSSSGTEPVGKGAYQLSLSSSFVAQATEDIPSFASAGSR